MSGKDLDDLLQEEFHKQVPQILFLLGTILTSEHLCERSKRPQNAL